MHKYEKVQKNFAKFFNSDMLTNILDAKVDQTQFESYKKEIVQQSEFQSLSRANERVVKYI